MLFAQTRSLFAQMGSLLPRIPPSTPVLYSTITHSNPLPPRARARSKTPPFKISTLPQRKKSPPAQVRLSPTPLALPQLPPAGVVLSVGKCTQSSPRPPAGGGEIAASAASNRGTRGGNSGCGCGGNGGGWCSREPERLLLLLWSSAYSLCGGSCTGGSTVRASRVYSRVPRPSCGRARCQPSGCVA